MYFICIEIQINYFFSKGFPILAGDWPPKKAFKTFGKLVGLSDLLNLCMKIKVRIINGKGINGSTWVKPNAIDCIFRAIIWKTPKLYAPIAALIGFHPPNITIARQIHP